MRTIALLALAVAPAAWSQTIYSWEDAAGVHYTDDLTQVPTALRPGGHARGHHDADLEERTPVVEATLQVTSAPMQVQVATTQPAIVVAPAARPLTEPERLGGLTEREWRDRFIVANNNISTLKASIAALYATLPPRIDCVAQPLIAVGAVSLDGTVSPVRPFPGTQTVSANGVTVVSARASGGPAGRCQVNLEHDRMRAEIAQREVELGTLERALDALEREASRESVPREWRRGW